MRVEKYTDILPLEFNELVEDFRSEGALIETYRQKNGLWTITAVFNEDAAAMQPPPIESVSSQSQPMM